MWHKMHLTVAYLPLVVGRLALGFSTISAPLSLADLKIFETKSFDAFFRGGPNTC